MESKETEPKQNDFSPYDDVLKFAKMYSDFVDYMLKNKYLTLEELKNEEKELNNKDPFLKQFIVNLYEMVDCMKSGEVCKNNLVEIVNKTTKRECLIGALLPFFEKSEYEKLCKIVKVLTDLNYIYVGLNVGGANVNQKHKD